MNYKVIIWWTGENFWLLVNFLFWMSSIIWNLNKSALIAKTFELSHYSLCRFSQLAFLWASFLNLHSNYFQYCLACCAIHCRSKVMPRLTISCRWANMSMLTHWNWCFLNSSQMMQSNTLLALQDHTQLLFRCHGQWEKEWRMQTLLSERLHTLARRVWAFDFASSTYSPAIIEEYCHVLQHTFSSNFQKPGFSLRMSMVHASSLLLREYNLTFTIW